jgi:hypothetical protein
VSSISFVQETVGEFRRSRNRLRSRARRVSTHSLFSMKAHQLIQAIGPELQTEIIGYLRNEQRGAYRAAIDTLAVQKKLRPVFIKSKTKEQQSTWLLDQMRIKSGDALAEQVIQIWLLKGQTQMLVTFLDAVGIEHDGNGEVKDLPEEITKAAATKGIKALLAENPPKKVGLYMSIFALQKEGGWPGLTEAMAGFPEIELVEP